MNRRYFLASVFATLAVPRGSLAAMNDGTLPYAAARLEDTDPVLFRISILQQMQTAGMPVPAQFVPFQESLTRAPGMDPQLDSVFGEAPTSTTLDGIRFSLDFFFARPPCNILALSEPLMAWRVFAALHETAHYIAFHTREKGLDLDERIFCTIYGIEQQKIGAYLTTLKQTANRIIPTGYTHPLGTLEKSLPPYELLQIIMNDQRLNDFLTAQILFPQLRERLADTAAALYILSNYVDTQENRKFLREVIDLRTAYYQDITHNTGSSISRALDIFTELPTNKMSIVEATSRAAYIIERQPEFTQGREKLTSNIRREELMSLPRPGFGMPPRSSELTTDDQAATVQAIMNARERACGLAPTL
jgi:hypothetical protein